MITLGSIANYPAHVDGSADVYYANQKLAVNLEISISVQRKTSCSIPSICRHFRITFKSSRRFTIDAGKWYCRKVLKGEDWKH